MERAMRTRDDKARMVVVMVRAEGSFMTMVPRWLCCDCVEVVRWK